MIRILFILYGCCFLYSCGSNSQPNNTSKNVLQESVKIALDSISRFYNCTTEISVGSEVGTRNVRYFEIETGRSTTIDIYTEELLHLPASNMAMLFYNNSKQEYDEIRVILIWKGKQYDFVYSKSDLEIAKDHLESLTKVSHLIASGQFEGVFSLMNKDIETKLDKQAIIDFCTLLNEESGKIKKIQFQGFVFTTDPEGRTLYLSCVEHREKQDTPFSIGILFESPLPNIKTIRYSL